MGPPPAPVSVARRLVKDVADFFRRLNGLQHQRPVLRRLRLAPHTVESPEPIGAVADVDAVDVTDVLGPLLVEEVHPTLAQATRGNLAGIVALDHPAIQDDAMLRLDAAATSDGISNDASRSTIKAFTARGTLATTAHSRGKTSWSIPVTPSPDKLGQQL
jgi:hypothetical protein